MSTASNTIIEYVIIIYAKGVATTVIGIADQQTAYDAFQEQLAKTPDWAHLIDGKGAILQSWSAGH